MEHQEKGLQLLATKVTEKIPDLRNGKDHYQSFPRKKNTLSLKQSKIVNAQPNTLKTQKLFI